MKILHKISIVIFAAAMLAACDTDEMVPVNPDFKVGLPVNSDGSYTASVGQQFYVTRTGSGEYLTLFYGTAGHVYGEPKAMGTFFENNDSLPVTYGAVGTYRLTVLASSPSDYGKNITRKEKTVSINVVDRRNSFTSFSVTVADGTSYVGNIVKDSIILKVPASITDFNFSPIFTLNSALAKAYVNGVEQTSGETANNFGETVEYVVKSSQGEESKYFVKVYTYPLSTENKLTRFALRPRDGNNYVLSNGEVGVINEENKTITLAVNYATNANSNVKYDIVRPANSTVFLNTTEYTPYREFTAGFKLSNLKTITVRAQNGTDNTYSLILTDEEPFITFKFKGLTPQPTGVIDHANRTITVSVLKGTPVTALIAEWKGTNGKVTVNGVEQQNGITVNDFTSPLLYQVYKGATLAVSYTVSLNIVE